MCEPTKLPFSSITGEGRSLTLWRADAPKAVVQIVHGMAEHIARYDGFARALCAAGYAVAGHNHLGHGPEAPPEKRGYFAQKGGWQALVTDTHRARRLIAAEFPGAPHVLLGHSMGSFVARAYIRAHAPGLSALVLSGTGYYPKPMTLAGRAMAAAVCAAGGAAKPAPLIDKLAFGHNNSRFQPARTPFDWLSRDEESVDRYMADELCGFVFTGRAFYDLFTGLDQLTDAAPLNALPNDLPVYLFSGDGDPVGGGGKGVRRVARQFTDAGFADVTMRLYQGGRHEMLNEINRGEVIADLTAWLDRRFA